LNSKYFTSMKEIQHKNRVYTTSNTELICNSKVGKELFRKKITFGVIEDFMNSPKKNGIIINIYPRDQSLGDELLDDSLFLVDYEGNKVWSAELPVKKYSDFYDCIDIRRGKLYSHDGDYLCQICLKTGKMVKKELIR